MSETSGEDNLPVPSASAVEVAYAMKRQGLSWADIAAELHTEPTQVYAAVRRRFKQEAQFLGEEEREMLLMLENERFDYMLSKLWAQIEYGDIKAIMAALAISRERRAWNHMDTPLSTSTTQVLVVGGQTQDYIEKLKELSDG